jgi:putative ABC transport system ATP-binding protein
MAEPSLELRGVGHTFNAGTPNEVPGLTGIDLVLLPGDFVVVLGNNGSGKSTLLNAVAGTFEVDSGSIRVDGQDVTRWPEHRRASLIGRVFQNPFHGTASNLSVAANLGLASQRGHQGTLARALPRDRYALIRREVERLGMGLEDRLESAMGLLSGGQRQALTLLMATLVRPSLLLLDEHTAALDPKSAELVLRLTEELIAREGLTTLMVTHSMAQAVRLGNRVLMMHRGRVVSDYQGVRKRRLKVDDLLDRFDEIRSAELLDESAAEMLERVYV